MPWAFYKRTKGKPAQTSHYGYHLPHRRRDTRTLPAPTQNNEPFTRNPANAVKQFDDWKAVKAIVAERTNAKRFREGLRGPPKSYKKKPSKTIPPRRSKRLAKAHPRRNPSRKSRWQGN